MGEKYEFKYKVAEGEEITPKKEPELSAKEVLDFVIEKNCDDLRQCLLSDDLLAEIKQNPDYQNSDSYLNFLAELKEAMEMNKELSEQIDLKTTPRLVKSIKAMLKNKYGIKNIELPANYKTVILDPLQFFAVHAQRPESEAFYYAPLKISYVLIETPENFEYKLEENMVHELIHALSKQTHWQTEIVIKYEKQIYFPKIYSTKRIGILTARKQIITAEGLKSTSVSAFRELNEAVTQKLTLEYFLDSDEMLGGCLEKIKKDYSEEQEALDLINQKIPFEVFVKAVFDKDAYRDLIRNIDKVFGFKAAIIVSELMAWENEHYNSIEPEKRNPEKKYFLTKEFLNGRSVELPAEIFKRIAPETAEKHPLITVKHSN